MKRLKQHAIWGRRGSFILAATGSAVGLGNIWKFPYITGENGGGAFVLMYLLCVAVIGLPILMAEIMLGRRGRANPIVTMQNLSAEIGVARFWNIIGWLGVTAGFLILSYYAVIAGWTLEYFFKSLGGKFGGLNGETSKQLFDGFLADQGQLVFWQSIFMVMTITILAFGINKGLETSIRFMMPLLLILLLILLGYAYQVGELATSARFMFSFNPEDLSWQAALVALGHAFFTLSLGMGAIMAYGSYMPSSASISKTVVVVACLDTLVALLVGLVIFAFVFATPGIEPAEGPGLMFVTLPVAFGQMMAGSMVAPAFFLMVILAAWTSTISILEPAVAYFTERFGFHRITASLLIGGAAWVLGLGSVFSFNLWSDYQLLWGMNFFTALDFVATNIMLPLGGLLIALFVGWVMSRAQAEHDLKEDHPRFLSLWRFVLRYLSPLAVMLVLLNGFYPVLTKMMVE